MCLIFPDHQNIFFLAEVNKNHTKWLLSLIYCNCCISHIWLGYHVFRSTNRSKHPCPFMATPRHKAMNYFLMGDISAILRMEAFTRTVYIYIIISYCILQILYGHTSHVERHVHVAHLAPRAFHEEKWRKSWPSRISRRWSNPMPPGEKGNMATGNPCNVSGASRIM